jgi:flagellar FliL protein
MALSAVKKETAQPAAEADAPAPAAKKRSINWKLLLIALCVIGAAAGAYWYMTQQYGDAHKAARAEPAKPPQFLPLEPFTVNLLLEDNPQFLQVGLTLKVADAAAVDTLKLHMPEIRDGILMLLSSQKASILLTLEGKRKLTAAIVAAVNSVIAPGTAAAAAASKAPAVEGEAKTADADPKAPAEDDAKAAEPDAQAAQTEAKQAAGAEPAPPGDAVKASSALPVLGVLFTSFIVQ